MLDNVFSSRSSPTSSLTQYNFDRFCLALQIVQIMYKYSFFAHSSRNGMKGNNRKVSIEGTWINKNVSDCEDVICLKSSLLNCLDQF
jgi:hypothetical protein